MVVFSLTIDTGANFMFFFVIFQKKLSLPMKMKVHAYLILP